MGNLIVYYGSDKNILKIVGKYKEMYNASVYKIKTLNNVSFIDKLKSSYNGKVIEIERCNLNLLNYQNIILISPLWYDKVPSPVTRFLEIEAGRINNIIYLLYNENKDDKPKEFDKMDKILNLRRDKSYFVTVNKNDIHVRVYQ